MRVGTDVKFSVVPEKKGGHGFARINTNQDSRRLDEKAMGETGHRHAIREVENLVSQEPVGFEKTLRPNLKYRAITSLRTDPSSRS